LLLMYVGKLLLYVGELLLLDARSKLCGHERIAGGFCVLGCVFIVNVLDVWSGAAFEEEEYRFAPCVPRGPHEWGGALAVDRVEVEVGGGGIMMPLLLPPPPCQQ
jgi:hypothetical protein